MVYLVGCRNREYIIEGVEIPKKEYNEREIELGKRTVVPIDDVAYARVSANKIFQSLVKNGDIIVRDRPPEGSETMAELRHKLVAQQDDSASRISALMEELDAARKNSGVPQTEVDALKAEAIAEINKRDARIAQLEAMLSSS